MQRVRKRKKKIQKKGDTSKKLEEALEKILYNSKMERAKLKEKHRRLSTSCKETARDLRDARI